MSAWSHLPNARYIDRVLESAKTHLEIWSTPWDAYCNRDAAHNEAWHAAWGAARDAAWYEATDAAWDVARNAARGEPRVAARGAIYDAVKALSAYDDANKSLEMPSDRLRAWAILSEEPAAVLLLPPAAVLLLPAVIAFEKIAKKEK
jgi:hypothetical protein